MWCWAVAGAWAADLSVAGDLAFAYGRNTGQHLNVAALVGGLELLPDPHLGVGLRVAPALGVGVGENSARAYVGAPLTLRVEGFPTLERNRPFGALGLGFTPTSAGGVWVAGDGGNVESVAWAVTGRIPTLMPEVGVDLGHFRASVLWQLMLGSGRKVAASVEAGTGGVGGSVTDDVPGLNGLMVQLGGHFGGPDLSP